MKPLTISQRVRDLSHIKKNLEAGTIVSRQMQGLPTSYEESHSEYRYLV